MKNVIADNGMIPLAMAGWAARALAIVLVVIAGSTMLARYAPGYLSDAREMDARYAAEARTEMSAEAARSQSLPHMLAGEIGGWLHGDAGMSRQFDVPVMDLLRPRLAVTGNLLWRSMVMAWLMAVSASIAASVGRRQRPLWQVPATLLLAAPTAAMATLCLLSDSGGPVLVMALLLAARDFKFLHRALRASWLEPHVLQARAQGIGTARLLWAQVLPRMGPQLAALASLSLVTALSAAVPVEVIFNLPGVGQMAWNAALNRDLPVLLAATVMMALAVTLSEWAAGAGCAAQAGERERA